MAEHICPECLDSVYEYGLYDHTFQVCATYRTKIGPHNGYKGAKYLRNTPYATVSEWRKATIDAIPDDEKCPKCKGSGADVILASNGGVGEVVSCWTCQGSGRKVSYSR